MGSRNRSVPWWRRRKYEKRANARRGALAQALPAPDPGTRVDVHGTPKPLDSRWPPAARSGTTSNPTDPVHPFMSSDSGPPTTVDDAGHSEEAGTSRSRTWRNGLSFTLLTAVALVSFISGLTMGLPVLGHGVRWLWLTAGAAGTVVFAWLAYQPWLELSRRTRIVAAGIPLAVACLVTVGVASNPVVIDGRVLPEWTSQAQSYRYADQMRDSLVTLADMDALLNTDNTQAWSRRGQIERSQAEAESIGLQYQTQIDNGDIPDPLFVTPTRQLVDAAYSAARALELRIVLLDTTDETNLVDEFNAARTVFQTQWTASATGLGSAARTLNLPLTLEVNQ